MFFARYLPPELATDLPGGVPGNLVPPPLVLTPEQEFFAGGYLNGYAALPAGASCAVTHTVVSANSWWATAAARRPTRSTTRAPSSG